METEFLDSILKRFETPQSEALFIQIYETFERATDPDEKVEPAVMSEYLTSVKSHLAAAKHSSATQFTCFQPEMGK